MNTTPHKSSNPTRFSLAFMMPVWLRLACVVSSAGGLIRALWLYLSINKYQTMKPPYQKLMPTTHLVYLLFAIVVIASNFCLAQNALNKLGQSTPQSATGDEIKLIVTVTKGRFDLVEGLTQQSFAIFDNKKPQQITSFSAEDVPLSVGILFDISGSVYGKNKIVKSSLATFFVSGNKANEYFLVGFSDRPELKVDWTRDGGAIFGKLPQLQGERHTALYDACRFGLEKVTQGTYPKRVIILISDGEDNKSSLGYKELREILRSSDVLVYAIGLFDVKLTDNNPFNDSSMPIEGLAILDELSGVTGGMAFYPKDTDQAKAVFEHIAMELRHQYSIGFRPDVPSKDIKWHTIKVKVNAPSNAPQELKKLIIRTREGYYPRTRTR